MDLGRWDPFSGVHFNMFPLDFAEDPCHVLQTMQLPRLNNHEKRNDDE